MPKVVRQKCRVCKKIKTACHFSKDQSQRKGLSSICKVCDNARYREYHRKNPKKASERVKRWYHANKHRRSIRRRILKYNREYYWKNRKRLIEYARRKRRENG